MPANVVFELKIFGLKLRLTAQFLPYKLLLVVIKRIANRQMRVENFR